MSISMGFVYSENIQVIISLVLLTAPDRVWKEMRGCVYLKSTENQRPHVLYMIQYNILIQKGMAQKKANCMDVCEASKMHRMVSLL